MAVVRTVRGDIRPEDLGITYLHEHLIGGPLSETADPDLVLDNEAAAAREMLLFVGAGGRSLVEMTTRDYNRNPRALRRIAEATETHIIAATGFIKGSFCDPFVEGKSIETLTEAMIRDVVKGIDDTGIRAGVIKAGSSKNQITSNEEKVFRAAARAHHATGAPISTHTEAGTMALEQIALLRAEGVEPQHILIGHMDRLLDWDYHQAVAKTGVTLGYDQFSKEKYYPDSVRIDFIVRMVKAGYRDQLALSGDLARKTYLTSYGGGPGFTFILWRIIPWLVESGLTKADIDAIFVQTPARLLAFQPTV